MTSPYQDWLTLRDAAINEACAAYRESRLQKQRVINRLERWAALSFSSFVLACAVIGVTST